MLKVSALLIIGIVLLPFPAAAQFSGGGGGGGSTMSGIGGTAANALGSDSVVNVKNYGVLGNGQVFYDGAMAIGSSTLTTKQTISTATQSSTTVTLTLPGGVPQGYPTPFYNWAVGKSIVVAGVSVSGYNGTFTITAMTGTTVQYTTTAGLGAATGGTAYTNSPFTSADAGKIICVASVGIGQVQQCGTISAFVDAQDVTLSFSNTSTFVESAIEFVYGTSDQAAIAAVISNTILPNGGMIFFPPGIYIMTSQLTIPNIGSWTIAGSGTGELPTNYGGNKFLGRPTTGLVWATMSVPNGSAAIVASCNGLTSCNGSGNFGSQAVTIRDLTIKGGAGYFTDGGGYNNSMHGIATYGINNFTAERVVVQNFSGDCFHNVTFWQQYHIVSSQAMNCGIWGMNVLGTQGSNLISNYIQVAGSGDRGGGGINMGSVGKGVNVLGNTVQGIGGCCAINLGPGLVAGNYFENLNVPAYGIAGTNAVFAALVGNVGTNPQNLPAFSVAGTALPACPATLGGGLITTRVIALVSDATACTNGTTYAGSGSIHCYVQCNGTNWIETGVGAY